MTLPQRGLACFLFHSNQFSFLALSSVRNYIFICVIICLMPYSSLYSALRSGSVPLTSVVILSLVTGREYSLNKYLLNEVATTETTTTTWLENQDTWRQSLPLLGPYSSNKVRELSKLCVIGPWPVSLMAHELRMVFTCFKNYKTQQKSKQLN